MDSCAKLNQTTFPQGVICLGNNLESNLNLLQNLRISQKSSDELRAEVEKTVKVSTHQITNCSLTTELILRSSFPVCKFFSGYEPMF